MPPRKGAKLAIAGAALTVAATASLFHASPGASEEPVTPPGSLCVLTVFTHYVEGFDSPLDPADPSSGPILRLPTEESAIASRKLFVLESTTADREDRSAVLSRVSRVGGDNGQAVWQWVEDGILKGQLVLEHFGSVRGWRVVEENYVTETGCDPE